MASRRPQGTGRPARGSRRPLAALVIAGLALGVFTLTPVSAHFSENPRHLGRHAWQQVIKKKVFTKQQANNRFARRRAESFHIVGAPGEPQFQNGWQNWETSDSSLLGFYKDSQRIVHLKGVITGEPPGTSTSVVFTLPPDYRPSELLILPVGSGRRAAAFILPDGRLGIQCGDPECETLSPILGFDGLSFRVGPGSAPAP